MGDGSDEVALETVPFENLAPCLVTAATTLPPSLPFFRSFLWPVTVANRQLASHIASIILIVGFWWRWRVKGTNLA